MLRLAAITPNDVVYDLGSGDGRIVIAAARDYGARGVGIDIDAALVRESTENARKAGVSDRTVFRASDIFAVNLREATVVTMYLLSGLVAKLEPKLLAELKPGTRIVAHDYGFEKWQPDRKQQISKTYMLYVVPARVAGGWQIEAPLTRGREFCWICSSSISKCVAACGCRADFCRRSKRGWMAAKSALCWWKMT